MSTSGEETFVYDGVEVRLTGRVAKKAQNPSSQDKKQNMLFEVTPVDKTFDWVKWVRPTDLYKISNND